MRAAGEEPPSPRRWAPGWPLTPGGHPEAWARRCVLTHQEGGLGDAAGDAHLARGASGAGVGTAQQGQGQEGGGQHGSRWLREWPPPALCGSCVCPPSPHGTGWEASARGVSLAPGIRLLPVQPLSLLAGHWAAAAASARPPAPCTRAVTLT